MGFLHKFHDIVQLYTVAVHNLQQTAENKQLQLTRGPDFS